MKLPRPTPLVYFVFIRNMAALGHKSENKSKSKNMNRRTKLLLPGLTDTEKQEMLDKHNDLRSTITLGNQGSHPSAANMIKMQWSDEFQFKSLRTTLNSVFLNITMIVRDNKTYFLLWVRIWVLERENLLQTVSSKNWFDEEENYGQCGQYTQVVWATSYAVGKYNV